MILAESPAIRRAKSIKSRVDEVSEEIHLQEQSDICDMLSGLVLDCLSLAGHWRAVVQHFSQQLQCNETVDLMTAGDILRPVAESTRSIYERVQARVKLSPCSINQSDLTDLKLAEMELPTFSQWLSTWPTWDPTERDLARQDYAAGKFMSAADLAAWASED